MLITRLVSLIGLLLLLGVDTSSEWPRPSSSAIAIEQDWLFEEVFYNPEGGLWRSKLDSSVVSGRITARYPNEKLHKHIPVIDGMKEGVVLTYFPSGQVMFSESYNKNRLDGKVQRWGMESGYQLIAQLNYKEGKLHGVQKKWYATGELHKLMYMAHGREEGLQRAYRKNGVLYANYEAKNGRVFGLRRTQLCFELDAENVVYEK